MFRFRSGGHHVSGVTCTAYEIQPASNLSGRVPMDTEGGKLNNRPPGCSNSSAEREKLSTNTHAQR